MPDFVTLTCPSCGGKLQIGDDVERFACGYCGNEHIVNRGGGIISLVPVAEDIKGIKTGVDKTAAELALTRVEKEISEILQRLIAIRHNFYNKYVDDGILKFSVAKLIENLEKKKYGTKFGFFTNSNKIYVERLSAITIEDIDFITEKSIYDMPKYYQSGCDEFLSDLQELRNSIIEFKNRQLVEKEAEKERLKKLLTY